MVIKGNLNTVKKILQAGGIAVIPTDTIYGLVGSALNRHTVERIYHVRKRRPDKPAIIMISSLTDLRRFSIKLSTETRKLLEKWWPGKVSVILPCPHQKYSYLHRGKKTLAFRMPDNSSLRQIIEATGPLIAPSANPESKEPAETISEAKNYFGQLVDTYVANDRRVRRKPSTIVDLTGAKPKIIRQGAVKITKFINNSS